MRARPLFGLPAFGILLSLIGTGFASWYFVDGSASAQTSIEQPIQITGVVPPIGDISFVAKDGSGDSVFNLVFEQNRIFFEPEFEVVYTFPYDQNYTGETTYSFEIVISDVPISDGEDNQETTATAYDGLSKHVIVPNYEDVSNNTTRSIYTGDWSTGVTDTLLDEKGNIVYYSETQLPTYVYRYTPSFTFAYNGIDGPSTINEFHDFQKMLEEGKIIITFEVSL